MSVLGLWAVACLLSAGYSSHSPPPTASNFCLRISSTVSLGKVSLIYFCLSFLALHTGYHLPDSSFDQCACLIYCFLTQALQSITVLLGLWGHWLRSQSLQRMLGPLSPSPGYSWPLWHKQPHSPSRRVSKCSLLFTLAERRS